MTMDDKVHNVVPYGKHETINFAERLLLNICAVLIFGVLLERHGVGLRDIILGWVFIQVTWKGTVDDVLFKFFEGLAIRIRALEDEESK